MTTSEKLQNELQKVLSGDPWYGDPVFKILEQVTFEAAFEKPDHAAHNIAEIMLHLLAWSVVVLVWLFGLAAGVPSSGDWPPTGNPEEQKWHNYVNDFKLVNVNLSGIIRDFPEEKWNEPMNDERNRELGIGVTYEELVNGLIQHHIYHSGQIAILNRIING